MNEYMPNEYMPDPIAVLRNQRHHLEAAIKESLDKIAFNQDEAMNLREVLAARRAALSEFDKAIERLK